jgi:hypothetical protein
MANAKNGRAKPTTTKGTQKKSAKADRDAKPPEWKEHLDSYKELQLLRFENDRQLEAAIDLLWTDDLRFLPHDTPDGKSIIIPAEAVEFFTRAGLKFTASRLRNMGELTPEERAKLKR